MKIERCKAGLFGATHPHSELHAKTLLASDWVSDLVIYDEDPDAARRLAESFDPKVPWTADLESLLQASGLHVAVADFTSDMNAALCCRLLDSGIHVLSEKPSGLNSEEILAIIERARVNERLFGVLYQARYHPIVRQVFQLIRSGVLGEITGCEGRLITSQARFRNPNHWLFQKDRAGGGILSWLGCHFLDLFLHLTGQRVTAVSAMTDTLGGDAIDVEDVAAVLLKFEGGAIGSLHTGYQLPLSSEGFVYPNYESFLAFRGTLGRAWWNPFDKPVLLHVESRCQDWAAAPARSFAYDLPELDVYGGVSGLQFFNCFFEAIHHHGQAPASGEDALAVARLVEAAYQSSATGRHCLLGLENDPQGGCRSGRLR